MEPSQDNLKRVFARLTGPLNFRFVLQPLLAILLGIRDGLHDAVTRRFASTSSKRGCKRQIRKALQMATNLIVLWRSRPSVSTSVKT